MFTLAKTTLRRPPAALCVLVLVLSAIACQSGGGKPAPTATQASRPTRTPPPADTRVLVETPTLTLTATAVLLPTHPPSAQETATQTAPPPATPVPATATDTLVPASPTAPPGSPEMLISKENSNSIVFLTDLTNSETGKMMDVVWSPDGTRLAVIGSLGVAMLAADTLQTLWEHQYFSQGAQMLFNQDGRFLVVLDGLGYITFFESQTGEVLEEIKGGGPIALSPDGSWVAFGTGWGVQVWDWQQEQEVIFLESASDIAPIITLDFSADGKKIMAGSYDQSVQVWQVADGKATRTFHGAYDPDSHFYCSSGRNAQYNTLIMVCHIPLEDYQGQIYEVWLWDVNNDQNQNVVRFTDREDIGYYSFTAGANRLNVGVFAGEQLEIWNVVRGFTLDRRLPATHTNQVAFNPVDGGSTLVVVDVGGLQIWDVTAKTMLRERSEWTGAISAVAFSPGADGRLLAAGNDLGTVELWNVRSGQKLATLPAGGPVGSLSFSRDGAYLAADGGGSALVWELGASVPSIDDIRLLAEFPAGKPVHAVALSGDGKVLASGGDEKNITVWNVADQTRLVVFETNGRVDRLALSPDGTTLAAGVTVYSSSKLQIWSLASRKRLVEYEVKGKAFTSLSFSLDGLSLLLTTDARFQVWDTETWDRLRSYYLPKADEDYYASAFSSDQCLVGFSVDYDFQLYDLASADFFKSFHAHNYRTYSVAFSPDGRLAATGGADGAVRIWGVAGALDAVGDPLLQPICPRVAPLPTATPTATPTITPTPTATPVVTATFTPTPPPFTRNLYLADPHLRGDDVLLLQQRLLELGYTEVGAPDGDFGAKTDAAVRHFQEVNGLEVDGVVGPQTWERLFSPQAVGVQ